MSHTKRFHSISINDTHFLSPEISPTEVARKYKSFCKKHNVPNEFNGKKWEKENKHG